MFFESWASLARTALSAVIAYAAVVVFLRVSGKRTLAKMNAFDLVVTVALGSTLAAVMTSKTLSLADGILALALLIGMQYVVAWLMVRSPWFERLVKSRPAALMRNGRLLDEAMRRERISNDEVLAAVRSAGIDDLDRVRLVVLETDGTMNVLRIDGRSAERPSTQDVMTAE